MESFGAELKRAREARGMSFDQIASITKIGTRFLRALEEEQFDQLPGGIFNKGFIRAYGRCLGLNEEGLIASYLALTETSQAATEEAPPKQPVQPHTQPRTQPHIMTDQETRLPLGAIAILAIVLIIAFAVHEFRSRRTVAHHQASSSQTFSSSSPSPSPSSASSSLPSPSPAQRGESAQVSALIAAPESKGGSLASPQPESGFFNVKIKAHEECWISVQADGKDVQEATLEDGQEKSVEAGSKLAIKVGNAGGVDFFFNGRKLPSQGEEEEVKTLNFEASGLRASAGR